MLNTALHRLDARRRDGRPLRVGVIGLGSFGRMVLTQLDQIPGIQIVAVADADRIAAREAVDQTDIRHPGLITDEVDILFGARPDVVVEATGVPVSGIAHAVAAIDQGCHVIMANSAADALAGPELARRARAAGVVYSLAQGDRPALICDLVTWARASGFEVMSAGRGAVYRRGYQSRTPDTVWELFDYTDDEIRDRGYNARNFTSLIDGTQCAMEMATVANACGLTPQTRGLLYPPCGADRLAEMLVPQSVGGILERPGTVEVVSTLQRDGAPVEHDLRYGVYVTLSAPNGFVARMFRNYGLATDASGRFASIHRPVQLLGLETPVSVISAGILGEDTGSPTALVAEVATVAKRNLSAGQTLDGIGGYTVYGRLMPAHEAATKRVLPIGLADGRKLLRPMPAGALISCDDVDGGAFPSEAVALRPGMVLRPRERDRIVIPERVPQSAAARAGAVVDPDDLRMTDGPTATETDRPAAMDVAPAPAVKGRSGAVRDRARANGANPRDLPAMLPDDASFRNRRTRDEGAGKPIADAAAAADAESVTKPGNDAPKAEDRRADTADADPGDPPGWWWTLGEPGGSAADEFIVGVDDSAAVPDEADDASEPAASAVEDGEDVAARGPDTDLAHALQALSEMETDDEEIDALLSDLSSDDESDDEDGAVRGEPDSSGSDAGDDVVADDTGGVPAPTAEVDARLRWFGTGSASPVKDSSGRPDDLDAASDKSDNDDKSDVDRASTIDPPDVETAELVVVREATTGGTAENDVEPPGADDDADGSNDHVGQGGLLVPSGEGTPVVTESEHDTLRVSVGLDEDDTAAVHASRGDGGRPEERGD